MEGWGRRTNIGRCVGRNEMEDEEGMNKCNRERTEREMTKTSNCRLNRGEDGCRRWLEGCGEGCRNGDHRKEY